MFFILCYPRLFHVYYSHKLTMCKIFMGYWNYSCSLITITMWIWYMLSRNCYSRIAMWTLCHTLREDNSSADHLAKLGHRSRESSISLQNVVYLAEICHGYNIFFILNCFPWLSFFFFLLFPILKKNKIKKYPSYEIMIRSWKDLKCKIWAFNY